MDLFSRFWEVRIMFFCYFGDPGAHFGGPGAHPGGPGPLFGEPGPHFEDFWNYYDFGRRDCVKKPSHFETYFNIFQLFAVLFFYVFSSVRFFDFLWF